MKSQQTNLFENSAADLPLFSLTPIPVTMPEYAPEPESNIEQLQLVNDLVEGETLELTSPEMLQSISELIEAKELLAHMKESKCFQNGVLMYWPEWLKFSDIADLVWFGYLVRTNGGPNTYSDSRYTLTEKD